MCTLKSLVREIMDRANSDGGPVHNGIKYCGIVPYLGIFLSDFTFLDEGSQTFLSPGDYSLPSRLLVPLSSLCMMLIFQFRSCEFEKSQAVRIRHQENQRVRASAALSRTLRSISKFSGRFQAKTYSLHVVPQLRDSLVNLEKRTFETDAKEEEAMYKRSLEVGCSRAAFAHFHLLLGVMPIMRKTGGA
jgi:hypothetical protein